MARNSRFDGLMVPTMRAAQRVRNKVGLYFDRRTDTPLVQRRDGSTVELGRLNIEEQTGTSGEMLTLRPDGRYRSGPLANGWRAHTRGIVVWEDFISGKSSSLDIGTRPWSNGSTGSGGSLGKVNDNQASQRGKCAGVVRITIASGSSDPSRKTFYLGHNSGGGATGTDTIVTPLPDDTWCAVKIRSTDSNTQTVIWAGMQDHAGRWPDDDASWLYIRLIGFMYRARDSPGNWQGIVRAGVTGGVGPKETLIDLGVAGNDTWHEFAWNYRSRGPNVGVQFYVDGAAVGSVVTTNLPEDAYGLSPIFGAIGTSGNGDTSGDKILEIDYFGFFAPCGDRW